MCVVKSCDGENLARGMCRKHYQRWYKHGDPLIVKKNTVRKGRDSSLYKHGMHNHCLYKTWFNMISRCTNKNDNAYKNYGGRGISVCERWMDIKNFIEDMGERPAGFSIDRIENDLGYSPENCKWSSDKEQARNRRIVKLTIEKAEEIRKLPRKSRNGRGDGFSRSEIAAMYGVSVATVKKVLSGEYWN